MRTGTFPNVALGASIFSALLWAGMLTGVSFLATPVKFQAVSLSLPVALEVGKVTFGMFSKVEWLLAALLAVSVFISPGSRAAIALAALVISAVAFESFWLLPVLDARIDAVIAGNPLPPQLASYGLRRHGGVQGCYALRDRAHCPFPTESRPRCR
jgi:hypothetical protein